MPGGSGPRVLTVIDSLSAGGAQSHLLALLRDINRGPYKTDVFSLVSMWDFYSADVEATGSRVIFGGARPSSLPIVMWRFAKTVLSGKYDIVHTYLPASFLFGAVIGRPLGIRKHVTTICARREQIGSPILAFRNYRRLHWLTHLFITPFPSQSLALGIPEDKIRFSLFAADYDEDKAPPPGKVREIVSRYGLEGAGPIALCIGRLHKDKGQEFAIRAHRRLLDTHPGAKLLILGEGFNEQSLRQAAEGIPGVVFCGVQKELAAFFAVADVYLNMAVNEGLNLAQLRAMAQGVPSIAFQTGLSEYEQEGADEAVLRIPTGDVEALTRVLAGLAEDPQRYDKLRLAGQALAARYGKDRVVRDYERFYDELGLANPSRPQSS